MEIIANKNYKRIKKCHLLEIRCNHCKELIALYQKIGDGGLLRLYNERIIEGTIDFSEYHGALFCPNCSEKIAVRYIEKKNKKVAYRLIPSMYSKKKVKKESGTKGS